MDRVNQFEFKPRDNNLSVTYQQPLQNVVREKLEQKQNPTIYSRIRLPFFYPVWRISPYPTSCIKWDAGSFLAFETFSNNS